MVTVSIILLTKNAGPQLNKLLNCINNQNFEEPFEIIAIDSGSQDNTLKTLKDNNIKIIQINPADFHHSRTRNLGAENACGKILVYLTQDALPLDKNWLKILVKPIKENNISLVYGRQTAYKNAKIMETFFYQYFYPEDENYLTKDDIKDKKSFYIDHVYISDVCSAINVDLWKKIQFDNDISMSEDKDFAIRALLDGHIIKYESKAVVFHSHNYTIKSLFKRRFKDGSAYSQIGFDSKDDSFFFKGLKYFKEELKFVISSKNLVWIPYVVLYDVIYFLGFQIGNYHKYLPLVLKNQLLKEN